MAVICPYCEVEISESALEAEGGCCPECGAIITAAGSSFDDAEDLDDELDDLDEEFDDDELDDLDEMDFDEDEDMDGFDGGGGDEEEER